MYYLLDENYRLRGYEKLPYCVIKRPHNEISFLDGKTFNALDMCDGTIDMSLPLITDEYREIVKQLEENGVVHSSDTPSKLKEGQAYKKHENRFIRTAHWSITGKCNFRCKHCYMSAPEAKLGELSHETVMDIARQIIDCGITRVSLTGGEPLIRKDFLDIVELFVRNDVSIVQIYSNGKLVTKELLIALDEMGVHPEFNMSYDGDDGWHDWLRGIPNAGKIVLDAFDLCHEMGFPTGSEMCLHKGNIHLLRQSINTLAKHHCQSLKTNPVSDTELWSKYSADYSMSMYEIYDAYLEYITHFFEDGMPISIMLGGFFYCGKGKTNWWIPSQKQKGNEPCEKAVICGHARQTLYISPEGRMLPCMPLSSLPIQKDYPLITDIGLAKGLSDSNYMKLINTRLAEYLNKNENCCSCEYRWQCAGGCRGSALQFDPNNIMGPDKAVCQIFHGGYIDKIRKTAEKAITNRDSFA